MIYGYSLRISCILVCTKFYSMNTCFLKWEMKDFTHRVLVIMIDILDRIILCHRRLAILKTVWNCTRITEKRTSKRTSNKICWKRIQKFVGSKTGGNIHFHTTEFFSLCFWLNQKFKCQPIYCLLKKMLFFREYYWRTSRERPKSAQRSRFKTWRLLNMQKDTIVKISRALQCQKYPKGYASLQKPFSQPETHFA